MCAPCLERGHPPLTFPHAPILIPPWFDTCSNVSKNIFDASAAEGAATDPRASIVGCAWSVASQTDILFDATSNVVALSLNGSGKVGFGDGVPAIPNNGGGGVTGDILLTNASNSVGIIWLKLRKTSGYDNIS